MGTLTMKILVSVFMLACAVSPLELEHLEDEDIPSPRYNCPMMDIDLLGNDLDAFSGVDNWQTCAHICNIAYESNCKFWTWNPAGSGNLRCYLKSSGSGMKPNS